MNTTGSIRAGFADSRICGISAAFRQHLPRMSSQSHLASVARLQVMMDGAHHAIASLHSLAAVCDGRRSDAGLDWQAIAAIDQQELAELDLIVSGLTAGADAGNYQSAVETLL